MFQHFCEKNLWKLKYWTTSRIDVIVRSSRLKTILNKLILKKLNLLLIRISNENDVFSLCFYCYKYEICKKKTREFFDCSTHHFLQLFLMYKKIFIFVKSLIEMSSNNVSSSNELNNILINKISFFFRRFCLATINTTNLYYFLNRTRVYEKSFENDEIQFRMN
jgi:hypothetical protein